MKNLAILIATFVLLGCDGSTPPPPSPTPPTSAVAEVPIGALKQLAKRLESPSPSDRTKAAEEIAKLGPTARPMQQRLKEAIAKETDVAVKSALDKALEKIGE